MTARSSSCRSPKYALRKERSASLRLRRIPPPEGHRRGGRGGRGDIRQMTRAFHYFLPEIFITLGRGGYAECVSGRMPARTRAQVYSTKEIIVGSVWLQSRQATLWQVFKRKLVSGLHG